MQKLFPLRLYDNQALSYEIVDQLLSNKIFAGFEISADYMYEEQIKTEYLKLINYAKTKYDPIITAHANPAFNLGFSDARLRNFALENLKQEIDFASTIGAKLMVIHPGCYGQMDVPKQADTKQKTLLINLEQTKIKRTIEFTIAGLITLCDYAKDKGVLIALENIILRNEVGKSPEDINYLFKAVNRDNLVFTLDAGHAYRYGINPADYLKRLDIKPFHLHLSDNDGHCDLHNVIGSNDIDFDQLFHELIAINFTGTVLVEVFLDNVNELQIEAAKIQTLIDNNAGI